MAYFFASHAGISINVKNLYFNWNIDKSVLEKVFWNFLL